MTPPGLQASAPPDARDSRRRGDGGFSLIELAVTLGIIGVLATIAIATYLNYRAKAQIVEARLGLRNIWDLESNFARDNSRYTADLGELGFRMIGATRYTFTVQAGAKSFTARAEANLDRDADLDVWELYYSNIEPAHLSSD